MKRNLFSPGFMLSVYWMASAANTEAVYKIIKAHVEQKESACFSDIATTIGLKTHVDEFAKQFGEFNGFIEGQFLPEICFTQWHAKLQNNVIAIASS